MLAEAGREARDPASAVRWFDAALRLLPTHDDARPRRLELMAARTTALGSAGRFGDCHDAPLETLAFLPASHSSTRARLLTFCACIENVLGQSDKARRRLLEALDSLPQRDCVEAVEVQIELCATYLARHDVGEATRWAVEIVAGAARTGDPALLACATATRALVEILVSDTPAPTPHADRAAVLFDDLEQTEVARYLGGALNLGVGELFNERYSDAVRRLERGIEASLATNQGHLLPMMRSLYGMGLAALGRMREAAEEADAAVESLRLAALAPPRHSP